MSRKLARSFICAHSGPQILKLLTEDATYARVFSDDGLLNIKDHKVLDQFILHTCPKGLETSPQIINWVFNQYLTHRHNNKPILAEDLYKVKDNLAYFDSLKKSQPFKESKRSADLISYKTYADFENMLAPFLKQKNLKEEAARQFNLPPEQHAQIMAESTVLYKGDDGMVVIPHTPFASQHWGSNTKWCIAGKEYADKYFPLYNAKSPIIMIITTGMHDQKVALVDNILYNSADSQIEVLAKEHFDLLEKAVRALSSIAKRGIKTYVDFSMAPKASQAQELNIKSDMDIKVDEFVRQISLCDFRVNKSALEIWKDDEVVLAVLEKNGWMLRHAPVSVRWNKALVSTAVKNFGCALEVAGIPFKDDFSIVLDAVKNDGLALIHASERLQNDREIVMTAVKNTPYAFKYASPELKNDRTMLLAVAQKSGSVALEFSSSHLKQDSEIVFAALRQEGEALRYASSSLKYNSDIVIAALNQHVEAFPFVPEKLKKDQEFIKRCFLTIDCLSFQSPEFFEKNKISVTESELKLCQIKALDRMTQRGDVEQFADHARHFKETWGNAELLFGGDMQQAMSHIKQSFKQSQSTRSTKPGFLARVLQRVGL